MSPLSLVRAAMLGIGFAVSLNATVVAGEYNITVDRLKLNTGDFSKTGIGYNGSTTPTILRFKEGEDVTINVTNNLSEDTSIHWHGLILPYQQDGVPGISYDGIKPGEPFTYNFPIVQSGTYWFHSHTGFQEPDGAYGAIIIEPEETEPFRYDREYVIQLTDSHPHSGNRIMRNLKMSPDYYNRKQRTLLDFFSDAKEDGLGAALENRQMWGGMRMMPTDIEDLQGFTPLINGKSAEQNWTGLFEKGERIRLRFINSSAMTYFDIRIPGLKMAVVQADGNNVLPVSVDEFRIAVAETYDVIVRPRREQAYSIIAESMGRTAMGRGTLAVREGLEAEIPEMREDPLLTMADMRLSPLHQGMGHEGHDMSGGMDHSTDHGAKTHVMPDGTVMSGAGHMGHGSGKTHVMADGTVMQGAAHGDHSAHAGHGGHKMDKADPFYAPGSGLKPTAANGGKFLSYTDLKAQSPLYEHREATREIELRLTGNMERYSWSINGIKYEDAEPIRLQYGERVRFKFVNETMMTHPMHLHGMWTIIDNGSGERNPVKHVVSVSPGTVVYTETEVDAPGQWAFHCHLSYHADAGMFRKVIVKGGPDDQASLTSGTKG